METTFDRSRRLRIPLLRLDIGITSSITSTRVIRIHKVAARSNLIVRQDYVNDESPYHKLGRDCEL